MTQLTPAQLIDARSKALDMAIQLNSYLHNWNYLFGQADRILEYLLLPSEKTYQAPLTSETTFEP